MGSLFKTNAVKILMRLQEFLGWYSCMVILTSRERKKKTAECKIGQFQKKRNYNNCVRLTMESQDGNALLLVTLTRYG